MTPIDKAELVLLTVGLAHHAPYLRLSHELLASSLRGRRWVLVDNSVDEALAPLERECGFEWVKGVAPPADAAASGPSMHHALGLRRGLSAVSSRYLLILDPDFFLLAPDALDRILAAMTQRKLVALGAPWTPELHYKWRGAPCLHCLLLDLKSVPKQSLRFEPEEDPQVDDVVNRAARRARSLGPLHALLGPLHQFTTGRIGIGQSRDTGWQVARELTRHHAGNVGLLPAAVFDRERFEHPWHLRYGWGWLVERNLPARWSYLPPADHYDLVEGADVAEIKRLKLDAFDLHDSLFALHARRSRHVFSDEDDEAAYIAQLSALVHKLAADRSQIKIGA